MSNENTKFYERNSIAAVINPQSGTGSFTSGWVSMGAYHQLCAVIKAGAFGASATVDANLQQAQDSSGTGAKAIGSGKAITQLVAAGGNNRQATIEVRDTELDTNNGFAYVQLTITVGTAATLVDGTVFGCLPQYVPASAFDATSVAQHV